MSTPKLSLVTLSVEVAKAHVLVLAVSIELPRFCQLLRMEEFHLEAQRRYCRLDIHCPIVVK